MITCLHRLILVSLLSSVFLEKYLTVPNALKIVNDGVREYNQKLGDHEKLDLTQTLFVSRNHTSRPSRCSGCVQPKKIIPGDLHFYVEGFLYLEKCDKVVETRLRFCLATSCTTNLIRYLNNIRPLTGTILRDPSLTEISQAELDRIKD